MASPHSTFSLLRIVLLLIPLISAAGMLAYLLSIYPSASFDPEIGTIDLSKRFPLNSAMTPTDPAFASVFAFARRLIAVFSKDETKRADEVTYSPGEDVAPVPKTLSPKQLKQALLSLASSNMLSDLPKGTPNLLIFNNATVAH